MRKIFAFIMAVLCFFCFMGCKERKFTTPGYDTLFEYCESSNGDIKVVDVEEKYYHEYVYVESNSVYDYILIGVACPTNNSIFSTYIKLELKKDQNICKVKIEVPSMPFYYASIDLKTFSSNNYTIDGAIIGNVYGSVLSEALIALQPTLKAKTRVSLKDLGFINY